MREMSVCETPAFPTIEAGNGDGMNKQSGKEEGRMSVCAYSIALFGCRKRGP